MSKKDKMRSIDEDEQGRKGKKDIYKPSRTLIDKRAKTDW